MSRRLRNRITQRDITRAMWHPSRLKKVFKVRSTLKEITIGWIARGKFTFKSSRFKRAV